MTHSNQPDPQTVQLNELIFSQNSTGNRSYGASDWILYSHYQIYFYVFIQFQKLNMNDRIITRKTISFISSFITVSITLYTILPHLLIFSLSSFLQAILYHMHVAYILIYIIGQIMHVRENIFFLSEIVWPYLILYILIVFIYMPSKFSLSIHLLIDNQVDFSSLLQ